MKRLVTLVCMLGLWSCEAPPAMPSADVRQKTRSGRIDGSVVVSTTARGKIVLFLYDANRPPPPVGTGRPLTFTVIARASVFGAATENDSGPFTAPFSFALVAPGRYLIRGLVDANDDFIPWYGVTADTTRGDIGGAAVDPITKVPRVVEVGVDEAGHPVPAVDVAVGFSDSARVPIDRPIFSVAGGPEQIVVSGQPTVVQLDALPLSDGVMVQPAPAFLLRMVDDDGDGVPDDANGDGRPDLWPRVVVRKLAQGRSPLIDENDLDKNGVVDAQGEDYEHVGADRDGVPDAVVLAAGFDPTEYASQLVDTNGKVKVTPTVVSHLKLVISPRAFDVSNPAAPQPLVSVPAGRYAVVIIQQTGQTWRVPNELSPGIAEAVGLPPLSSQSVFVQVP
jgi:hypothetical protein